MNSPFSNVQFRDLPNFNQLFGNIGNSWDNALPNDLFIKGVPKNIQKLFATTDIKGNIGGGLDNLQSFLLPAKGLKSNGSYIDFAYAGNLAANNNDKQVSATFDGQTFLDSGLTDLDLDVGWFAWGRIIRLTSTSIRACSGILMNLAQIDSANAVQTFGAGYASVGRTVTLTAIADLDANDVTIQVKGQGTNNDDVTQNISILELTRF